MKLLIRQPSKRSTGGWSAWPVAVELSVTHCDYDLLKNPKNFVENQSLYCPYKENIVLKTD